MNYKRNMTRNKVTATKVRLRVDKPVLAILQSEYKISEAGLYNALAGRSNSERAKQIRDRARNMGAAIETTYEQISL